MPRLLLVEDDSADEELTRMLLLETGAVFEVEVVRRIAAALERLGRGGIDVVVMDLGLPDGGGATAVERIVARAPAVPVVVLTGSFRDDSLERDALEAGARAYLVKGNVSAEELGRVLRGTLPAP